MVHKILHRRTKKGLNRHPPFTSYELGKAVLTTNLLDMVEDPYSKEGNWRHQIARNQGASCIRL
jgi:hypothetical protein